MVLTSSGREREGAGLEGESGSVLGTGHLEGQWLLPAETGEGSQVCVRTLRAPNGNADLGVIRRGQALKPYVLPLINIY